MAKAKKKVLPILDTAELIPDADNPRKISPEAAAGLASSMERFGDLSGIVWNKQSGELVCGHRRLERIREKWGDQSIEVLDIKRELGGIAVDESHYFPVRIVDWSKPMQRAANVAANSQVIAGSFDDNLDMYLAEIRSDLDTEAPGLYDELLMADLTMTIGGQSTATNELVDAMSFQVIVECDDENDQVVMLDRFAKEGYKCRALIL